MIRFRARLKRPVAVWRLIPRSRSQVEPHDFSLMLLKQLSLGSPPPVDCPPPLWPAITRRGLATALHHLREGPRRPPSAPDCLSRLTGAGASPPPGRTHRAGRGREPVRYSRPGGRGPRAPLSHPTPAVFAAKHCERNFADMSYPVISYSSMAYAEPIVGETSLTTSLLVKPGMHQGRGHVHAPARSWGYPFTAVCCWVMGRALGRSLRSALADGRPMIAKHSAVCLQACKPESAS
jgi:hypothetical protein